jgi:hypothetical protein
VAVDVDGERHTRRQLCDAGSGRLPAAREGEPDALRPPRTQCRGRVFEQSEQGTHLQWSYKETNDRAFCGVAGSGNGHQQNPSFTYG